MADPEQPAWVLPIVILELILCFVVVIWIFCKDENRWQPPSRTVHDICATIWDHDDQRRSSLLTEEGTLKETDDGENAVATGLQARNARVLAIWRTLVFGWMLFVQIHQHLHKRDLGVFLFFTVWNYHLQILFYFLAAMCSVMTVTKNTPSARLRTCVGSLFEICFPVSILVTIVLWGILAPNVVATGTPEQIADVFGFTSYNQHLSNTICLLIEFGCSRMLVKQSHFLLVAVWAGCYCVFSWIQYPFTGFWAYFFLYLTPWAVLWYMGLILLHYALFSFAAALSRCKAQGTYFFRSCQPFAVSTTGHRLSIDTLA